MVHEAVQVHHLRGNTRNLARTAVLCRRPVRNETPAAITRRQNIADEYESAAFDLRDRALARLDIMIADSKSKGVDGAVRVARLQAVRAVVNTEPFLRLDADNLEIVYFKLNKTLKDTFWLARYDENVVTWYWAFRGVMDIRATISQEPFESYSRQEFAFVCNMTWMEIICRDVFRGQWVQEANVQKRSIKVSKIIGSDRNAWRKECDSFNEDFNIERENAAVAHGGLAKDLSHIMVCQEALAKRMASLTRSRRGT